MLSLEMFGWPILPYLSYYDNYLNYFKWNLEGKLCDMGRLKGMGERNLGKCA